ncbi:MAG TPA: diaminobutyrate--2-oxoglutarate transaminase family protein [Planosporangium sp.]|nr:diaminobutyrate--2-oxoglutarate transaminase family protein [Planosporangium sp.]
MSLSSGNDPYLAQQALRESNARTYPRCLPLALVHGDGLYVTAADGRTYLDCLAGAGTLTLGHNHPVVVDAIRRALDSGVPLHTLDFATPVKHAFVEELFARLPAALAADARVQFCGPAGTDAVEAALKLVEIATGRRGFLAFHGGYHGMTRGALAVSGKPPVRAEVAGIDAAVRFLPYPSAYRCPFGLGGADGERACVAAVEQTLSQLDGARALPAGLVVEVVQGEGGSVAAPDHWLRAVRALCTAYDVAMIVDEVQTGGGRTGRLLAIEHSGVLPDVLVLSKAIGGGLPLALIVYRSALDCWEPGAHAGTFRGNQLAMAAGTAALRYTVDAGLADNADQMGRLMTKRLNEVARQFPAVGDVRGRGLMLGVEMVDPAGVVDRCGAYPPAAGYAARTQRECLRRGLIVEVGGVQDAVVRFLPPLTLTVAQVDAIVDRFAAALAAAAPS